MMKVLVSFLLLFFIIEMQRSLIFFEKDGFKLLIVEASKTLKMGFQTSRGMVLTNSF
ncbi:hypothetical protein Gohar_010617, partial [Gossypium harknessii]|nr:hypothetical protein [Gossypium harknessii]